MEPFFFGQASSAAGENLYFYDPSGPLNGIVATEAEIAGSGLDVSFQSTQFEFLDGRIYFNDLGTNDAIRSIDPDAGPTSLELEMTRAELEALTGTFIAADFDLFQGELAFATFGADGVIYGIPEPSTALLGLLGLISCLRRKRFS